MVSAIRKIIHSYTTSAWIPFLLMAFFLFISSILVVSGGLYLKSPLTGITNLCIKLYACSLLGQLYVSFCNFFGRGTTTGTIQLLLFLASLLISFLAFFFLLLPSWKIFFKIWIPSFSTLGGSPGSTIAGDSSIYCGMRDASNNPCRD